MSSPRETNEWRWIPVYTRTTPTTQPELWGGPTSYAIVKDGQRPVLWTAADVRAGFQGASISGLGAGVWHVYAKATAGTNTPVIDCGTFTLN